MAGFNFDQVEKFTERNDNKINFLKLEDNGWYAKVRFMYGEGEMFRGETVHNVSEDPKRPRYVSCLREEGQPVDVCPLCQAGSKIQVQFYVPVYVQSIVTKINGIENEQQVGQVMIFQRGTTFTGAIQTVLRYAADTKQPIVNSLFRLVRNGARNAQGTTYSVEYIGTDNVTLEMLPPRPEVVGSYILPKYDAAKMIEKYINKTPATPQAAPAGIPQGIQPRQGISASTFVGGSTYTAPAAAPSFNQPMNNANQAPLQAPQIGNGTASSGVVPF